MYVFIALCVLVFICVLCTRKNMNIVLPPLYSGALPIIGHAHRVVGGDAQFLHRRAINIVDECNEKGGVMLLKFGTADYYVITDPEDFNTAANQCLQAHYLYSFVRSWLGEGLITGTDVSLWKRHRKLISPAFGQHVLDGFLSVFNAHSKELVDQLAAEVGNGPFIHSGYIDKCTLLSTLKTSFGVTADSVENFNSDTYLEAVTEYFHVVTLRFQKWWLFDEMIYNYSKLKRDTDKVADYLNRVSKSVLRMKKKNLSHGKTGLNDTKLKAFMDLTLELSDKGELTDTEVYQEMNTIIAAGYETTGNTLMYTLLLLGSHADVQNKVYEELLSVFGDSLKDVEKVDLPKLVYLDAVLKEAMRVYTFTPVMLRTVTKDVKLKNYTMPAGSHCLLFTLGLHRHLCWGDDVESFRPERWLDQTLQENFATTNAFAAFGIGKRLCLGKTFAMMSMKTTLAHILHRYRVSSDTSKLKLKLDPLLKPVSGNLIELHIRRTGQDISR